MGCVIFCDSKITGRVGRAIVGGILAGEKGAMAGILTAKKYIMSYSIMIYCAIPEMPSVEIILINKKTATKDTDYQEAVEFAYDVKACIKVIASELYPECILDDEIENDMTIW